MHKEVSLRHLHFNRFLSIRYSTAFFLFLNLYWAIFLIGSLSIVAIFPSTLFVLATLTMLEQVKIYRNHTNKLPYAQLFYKVIFISYCLLMITLYSPLYIAFYPFLIHSQNSLNILTVFIFVNMGISFLMIKKVNKIKLNQDSHFKRILSYKALINETRKVA